MRALKELWTPTSRLYDRADEGQPQKRVLDCGIAWQNYRDVAGIWQPTDADYSEPDGEGFTARFSRVPRLVRMGNDGRRRVYPVEGNDAVWLQLLKPAELNLGAPTSKIGGTWTWNRPRFTLVLSTSPGAIKFRLVLKQPVGVTSFSIPFDSQGLTRQGRFLLAGGVPAAGAQRWV